MSSIGSIRRQLCPSGDAGSHTLTVTIRRILLFKVWSNDLSFSFNMHIKGTLQCFCDVSVIHFPPFVFTVLILNQFLPLWKHSSTHNYHTDICIFTCSCSGFIEEINSWQVKTSKKYWNKPQTKYSVGLPEITKRAKECEHEANRQPHKLTFSLFYLLRTALHHGDHFYSY